MSNVFSSVVLIGDNRDCREHVFGRSFTKNLSKCGTVYRIHSKQCGKENVGDSSLFSETKVKEHLSGNLSAIQS